MTMKLILLSLVAFGALLALREGLRVWRRRDARRLMRRRGA